jgi:lysophospholipase L1-like esterase
MKIIEKLKAKQSDLNAFSPVTIAFLGDSVTQGCFECYLKDRNGIGTVFDSKYAFSEKVKEILNILYPSVQVNVVNSGISGDNATNGLKRLERDVLKYSPDLVVVGFALNDSTWGETGLDGYAKSIQAILKRVLETGAECILLTPNMMNVTTSDHLKDELFIRLSKEFAEIQKGGMLSRYVETEIAVAKEMGVPVCDIYGQWLKLYKGGVEITELLANKLNHPIREIHYYTAIKLVETIFKELV